MTTEERTAEVTAQHPRQVLQNLPRPKSSVQQSKSPPSAHNPDAPPPLKVPPPSWPAPSHSLPCSAFCLPLGPFPEYSLSWASLPASPLSLGCLCLSVSPRTPRAPTWPNRTGKGRAPWPDAHLLQTSSSSFLLPMPSPWCGQWCGGRVEVTICRRNTGKVGERKHGRERVSDMADEERHKQGLGWDGDVDGEGAA